MTDVLYYVIAAVLLVLVALLGLDVWQGWRSERRVLRDWRSEAARVAGAFTNTLGKARKGATE